MQYLSIIKSIINNVKKCIYKKRKKCNLKILSIKCGYKKHMKKPFIKIPYKIR